jgi:hypothetical protein
VEVVDRHREAALALAAAPGSGHGLELGLQLAIDGVRSHHADRVAGLPQPRDRLPHLADRAAFEGELLRAQHSLLPHRHGLEPEGPVAIEVRIGGADDREPPAAGANDAPQLREELVHLLLVAHRIAADQRRPRHHSVGEEGAARRREEVALVPSQRKEGEAVSAVCLHDRSGDSPLADRLRDRLPERPQPVVERRDAHGQADPGERVGGTMRQLGAAQLFRDDDRRDACERRSEPEQRPDARRVAGHVEAMPPPNERREQQQGDDRLLEVEALREMRDGRGEDDRDRELPGPPPALRERPGEPHQPDAEGDREDPRGLGPARRQHAAHELDPVGHLRGQRRDDADHADERGSPREQPL